MLADWMKAQAAGSFAGHILTFAWNEFEEGGMICPTVGKDGKPDTSRVKTFAKIADYFRRELAK